MPFLEELNIIRIHKTCVAKIHEEFADIWKCNIQNAPVKQIFAWLGCHIQKRIVAWLGMWFMWVIWRTISLNYWRHKVGDFCRRMLTTLTATALQSSIVLCYLNALFAYFITLTLIQQERVKCVPLCQGSSVTVSWWRHGVPRKNFCL